MSVMQATSKVFLWTKRQLHESQNIDSGNARGSEFCFCTERQLCESEHVDTGNTSDKQILLRDQPTVTRIQEYRFRKYKQRVSFPFGLNDSCTNQTILTLEMHATDDIYFWTERQLHDRKEFDAGSASVRRLLLLD